jgi:hypothetical protein
MPPVFIRQGRRLTVVAAVAAAAVVGLSGCGSSSSRAGPSGRAVAVARRVAADPCALLTNDDINAALSAPITGRTVLAGTSCTYMLPSVSKDPGEVDVLVSTGARGREHWRVDHSDPVVAVDGIGDEAWTITNSQYHKIGFHQGDVYVFLTVVQDDPDHPDVATLKTLARDVLGHIS